MTTTPPAVDPPGLHGARLPRWALPRDWPTHDSRPCLADVRWTDGCVTQVLPSAEARATDWQLQGAPVLPGLVEAHTHIDKAFTRPRLGALQPGLLAAIQTMIVDRQGWTEADVRARATRALQWASQAGVVHLRTHCDWWEPQAAPLAWGVLGELAQAWRDRVVVQRVSLMNLQMFAERDAARRLARAVARGGTGACLGGFVHSTNWSERALRHLLEAAAEHALDVDLHCDEELNPQARGLATTARLVREIGYAGRLVAGHACALASQDDALALATLDAVAAASITLVCLPTTNLLLQDARTGRTPRQRGLTLVKEARARGIPVLISSDNVQDAFCPVGSFDPVEALAVGVLAAQLDEPFDVWSESVCRADWLGGCSATPLRAGSAADLVIFSAADVHGWPARAQSRVVVRAGRRLGGEVPGAWLAAPMKENCA